MDNLSHSLAGLVMARAGLNRITPHATLLLILSANAPDMDILALIRGKLAYFEAHRGPTHALLAIPLLALVCELVVAAVFRQRLPWLRAWLVCCVGTSSHLLLDWTNSYGIRLFLPFSGQWLHADLNALTDIVLLVALLFAAVWPLFSKLVGSEIGERRRPSGRPMAIAALSFCVIFDIGRYALHNRALTQLESQMYDGAFPTSAAALPDGFNPFQWTGIVETAEAYRRLPVNTLGSLDLETAKLYYLPVPAEPLDAARKTREFASFLRFTRFPVWSVQPVTLNNVAGKRVELADLRFGGPGQGAFHCIALESQDSRVLHSWFTYGNGAELGWSEAAGR